MNVRADGIQLEVTDAWRTRLYLEYNEYTKKGITATVTRALVKSASFDLSDDGSNLPIHTVHQHRNGEWCCEETFDDRLNTLCRDSYAKYDEYYDNLVRIEPDGMPKSILYGILGDEEPVRDTDNIKAPVYFLILDSLDLALRLDNGVGDTLFKQITSIRDIEGVGEAL